DSSACLAREAKSTEGFFAEAVLATSAQLEFGPNTGWQRFPNACPRSQPFLLAHGAGADLFLRRAVARVVYHGRRVLVLLAVHKGGPVRSVRRLFDWLALLHPGSAWLAADED